MVTGKNCRNCSHDSAYKKASSNLLIDKTYWIVALRMSVLVSTLDAGLPKTKVWVVRVESFCSRNLWLILFILLGKVFLSSANKGQCKS